MNVHKNARLTPRGRERIALQVDSGQTPEAVAEAAGVCPRTVRKWVDRYRREGLAGLQDRSSRPHRLRQPTPQAVVVEIERLRRQRWTGKQIALPYPPTFARQRMEGTGVGPMEAHYFSGGWPCRSEDRELERRIAEPSMTISTRNGKCGPMTFVHYRGSSTIVSLGLVTDYHFSVHLAGEQSSATHNRPREVTSKGICYCFEDNEAPAKVSSELSGSTAFRCSFCQP